MIEDLKVPQNEVERQKWADKITDTVGKYSQGTAWNKQRFAYEDNHRKFIGDLNPDDYKYITSIYGQSKPMKFANYPLLEPLVQRMVGEYTSRPIPFTVSRINKNAYSEKMNLMSELAAEKITAPIIAKLEKQHKVKIPIEQRMQFVPDQFKNMPQKSIRDSLETNVKYGLNYLHYTYDFESEWANSLYDITVNNDCMSRVEVWGNDPVIRHEPIQNCIFQRGEGNYVFDRIHRKSPFMGTDTFMTLSDIITKFGHWLKREMREQLMDDQKNILSDGNLITSWADECGYGYMMLGGQVLFRVVDIEVKCVNEKKFLKQPYRPDSDKVYSNGDVGEVWEMTKIGRNVYLRPRKRRNQIPLNGNPTDLQFSWFGMLSRHSFYTRAFPVQLLYSNCLMTLDFLLNQSGGKATRYATERQPDGYELEDVAYSGKVLGLVLEQIRAGDVPGRSTASGEIDFGISASSQYIIALATMLTQTAERMTGIPDARSGRAASTAPVGTVQSNIQQGSYMTKPIFDVMARHTETGLQRCADLIKYLWEGDETKAYIGGDGLLHIFKVSQELRLSEMGIYVQSNVKVAQEKEYVLAQMEKVLATDATMILELVKAFNAETGAEAQDILELGVGAMRAHAQQMEKSKIEIEGAGNQLKGAELEMRKEELRIKATIPVEVAKINRQSAETVALVNKETALNKVGMEADSELHRALLEDIAEGNAQQRDQMHEVSMESMQPQEQEQPA